MRIRFTTAFIFFLPLLITACNLPVQPAPGPTAVPPLVAITPTIPPTASFTAQLSNTPNPSPTTAPTQTNSPSPSPTLTLPTTPVPTFVNLHGEVIVDHANCRYGPGAPYLYKYGLVGGSNLEIIGRLETGSWIEVRAIGGNNPCWVKADLMKISGDLMNVAPIDPMDVVLPQSPYYGPLTGVSASRRGENVTISWNPLVLRAGDDSEQFPYLLEAWVCQSGKLVFVPTGSYTTSITLTDESGCSTQSHARVYGVEKHGYTRWVEIPWPHVDKILTGDQTLTP